MGAVPDLNLAREFLCFLDIVSNNMVGMKVIFNLSVCVEFVSTRATFVFQHLHDNMYPKCIVSNK